MVRSYKQRRVGGGRARARGRAGFKRKQWRGAMVSSRRAYVAPMYRSIVRASAGQPTKKLIKFKYNDVSLLAPAAGATASLPWRANGVFDPYAGAGGTQPRGYDQWTPFYDHVVVIKCKITVNFDTSVDSANPSDLLAFVLLDDSNSRTDATEKGICESNHVRYKNFNNTENRRCTISYVCNPNKFLGRSKPLSDPDIKGTMGVSDPLEQCYWIVGVINRGSIGSATARISVNLEYTCVMIEPKDLAAS